MSRVLTNRSAGFTLVETLVALAVVALVASLVAGYARTPPAAARVGAEARQVAALLQRARAEALATQRETRFMLDGRGRRYGIVGGEGRTLAPGVSATAVLAAAGTAEAGLVRFFPGGTTSGGEIRLAVGVAAATVSVNWATGAIAVEEPRR